MENSIIQSARIGGILYLLLIIVGMFAILFVKARLVVSGDVTATANNIMASQFLWHTGIVAGLIMHIFDSPVMLVIYVLLKPVNNNLALLGLLCNLTATGVLVANKINLIGALLPLESLEYLKTLDQHQLHAQAYLSIKLDDIGFGVGLIFFGFTCLVNGYLIFRSGYLPRIIGLVMQIAGVCYLANSFILLLVPKFSSIVILMPCLIGELSFCLWLIVKGVNVTKWKEKANAAQVSGA